MRNMASVFNLILHGFILWFFKEIYICVCELGGFGGGVCGGGEGLN